MAGRLGRQVFLAALVIPPLAGLARAESIEDVEKKLVEAHAKLKSYVARLKDGEDIPLTAGDFIKSDTTGTVEWMRKGDKILYRMEISGRTIQKFGTSETKGELTSTFVCDGDLFYTLGEQLGVKRFIKQKRDDSINGDFRTMLNMVKNDNSVLLVADGKVDGADCHVVEIMPKAKPADNDPIHKTLAFFRKDIGLAVRVASYNREGKEIYSHTLLDLKTDVSIDAARFVLKPPPDVEVTDLTGVDDKATTPSLPSP